MRFHRLKGFIISTENTSLALFTLRIMIIFGVIRSNIAHPPNISSANFSDSLINVKALLSEDTKYTTKVLYRPVFVQVYEL